MLIDTLSEIANFLGMYSIRESSAPKLLSRFGSFILFGNFEL